MSLRIFDRVLDAMHAEAQRYEVETGGVLVGPDEDTLSELLPSGAAAHRTATSYQLDVAHLQPLLDEARGRGLAFRGIVHVHPEGCPELSGTDRATAKGILSDPGYGITRLWLPLMTRLVDGFETRFFLAEGDEPTIRQVAPVIVHRNATPADSGKFVGVSKQCPKPNMGQPARGERPKSSDSRDSLEGNDARLWQDIQSLRADGWQVSCRDLPDQTALRVERAAFVFWLILPSEYPLNPPDVFYEDEGRMVAISHANLPETHFWSSQRSLRTVVNEAERSVGLDIEAPAPVRRSRYRNISNVTARLLGGTL